MDFLTILQITDSGMRMATPLLFACLAGLFSERSGIFDIGLEGKILVSAFFSAGVAAATGSVWIGLLAGLVSSLSFSLMHGLASITFRGNQLISGVALNYFASGITILIGSAWFGLGGRTPSLKDDARFANVELPFAWTKDSAEAAGMKLNEAIAQAGPLQQIYSELLSGHTILVYVALAMVPLSWWVLNRTRFGLRLRAVGENPGAVDTAGVSVIRLRYAAMGIAGLLCGLAGAYAAVRVGGGLYGDRAERRFRERDVGWARLYRPGRADLCKLAALARVGRNLPVRRVAGGGQPLSEPGYWRPADPGSTDGGPALYPDRDHPGRVHRHM